MDRLNPNGGTIALGHPNGMSGARLALTLIRELHERNGRHAIASLCIGGGQGTRPSLKDFEQNFIFLKRRKICLHPPDAAK
jgi:acetyl-CoA acetyltransferase